MARSDWRDVDGVLLLDKPRGLSSNDALQRARRALRARKAGHGGTLDPLADGLLPIALGEATKFLSYAIDADKTYLARIRLGEHSSTGDGEGEIVPVDPERGASITPAQVRAACASATGAQQQRVPIHSAVKRDGRPLYDYARKGIAIEAPVRSITVHALDLIEFEPPLIALRIRASKGTYVRVLVEDIGAALGCGAWLCGLTRERVGPFRIDAAIGLEALERMAAEALAASPCGAAIQPLLMPLDAMLGALPPCVLGDEDARRFLHGQAIGYARVEPPAACHSIDMRIYHHQRFIGLGRHEGTTLTPVRLVADRPNERTGNPS